MAAPRKVGRDLAALIVDATHHSLQKRRQASRRLQPATRTHLAVFVPERNVLIRDLGGERVERAVERLDRLRRRERIALAEVGPPANGGGVQPERALSTANKLVEHHANDRFRRHLCKLRV